MPAAETMSTVPSDRIDFINENNARSGFFSLLKHIANSRRSHADKHLDEIRTADAEKWNVRFSGNRPGQKCLAGSGRSDHQNAFRNPTTKFLEFLRVL